MKRLLLFLLVLIFAISCTKEKKVCWKCTFMQSVNGTIEPPRKVCNNGEFPTDLTDAQGNDLPYTCEKQ